MSGCSGWDSINPICRGGQLLGGAASSVGNDIFAAIAHYFADAANSMVTWLWGQLNVATSIDLLSDNFKRDLVATGAIAGLVTFALFLVQVIASVLRQDAGGLGRAARGLAVAFIGAAFAVASTQVLLAAVDALCNGVVQFALGTDLSGLGAKLIAASALSNVANPAGLLLLALVLIAAVVVVWIALMIRKMLIIVSAVFAPIAFSGASADISRSWVRRWVEFTLALVFSKLILVIVFMIGLSVLNGASSAGAGAAQTITNLAVGALTLLLAGFAPWIAIKMVHFAGDSFHAVHAQAATASAGAQTLVAAPQKASSLLSRGPSPAGSPQSASAARTATGSSGQPKSEPAGGARAAAGSGASAVGPAAGVVMAAASAARNGLGEQSTRGIEAGQHGGRIQGGSSSRSADTPPAKPLSSPVDKAPYT